MRWLGALLLLMGAASAEPQRILSLNLCTDQLLVDLAEPGQILGLSPFARDASRSWASEKVSRLPALSGTAEEAIALRPDLVVSSQYMKRETRALIAARGIKVVAFEDPATLAAARSQILEFGRLIGAESRAEARVTELDAAIADLRAASAASPRRVLPFSRRGWVAGRETLMADILREAGLINVAGEMGLSIGGFARLEAVVLLKPDLLLLTREPDRAEDQGQALLLHPALARLFPPEKRIVLRESLTVCGGPALAEALRKLAALLRNRA
ncbi:MAG: ABC transporter substrate-binding protein [Beijerinckiaceae bacterium]|jgi:iron complex transport system substrate-binding protein|nr:ABC transporter substrate-binding protein [Beijerinckiaceae bacterium]